VLLQAGADIGLLDESGKSPGQYATANQCSELGKALALDDSLQLSDRITLLEKATTKQAPQQMSEEERQALLKSLYCD